MEPMEPVARVLNGQVQDRDQLTQQFAQCQEFYRQLFGVTLENPQRFPATRFWPTQLLVLGGLISPTILLHYLKRYFTTIWLAPEWQADLSRLVSGSVRRPDANGYAVLIDGAVEATPRQGRQPLPRLCPEQTLRLNGLCYATVLEVLTLCLFSHYRQQPIDQVGWSVARGTSLVVDGHVFHPMVNCGRTPGECRLASWDPGQPLDTHQLVADRLVVL